MSEIEETIIPELEKYSFSKLSSWHQCKYGYYQKYIEHKSGEGNAFSSYGSFVHEILEKYAKGEYRLWDLPSIYEWGFDAAIKEKFPWNKYKNLRQSYHDEGLTFLKKFQGYDDYKILGVEQGFEIQISDWTLIGYIDLIFEDDGEIVIRDYKSKAEFKNDKELKEYARQMYLYSTYVKKEYGKFPKELQFLNFRKTMEPKIIAFDEDDYNEAIEWANNTVREIRNAFAYPPMSLRCGDFYASELCNHRKYCIYNEAVIKKAKEEKDE